MPNVVDISPASGSFWRGRRTLVTGGGGFIGSAVVDALRERRVDDAALVIPRSRETDLRSFEQCRAAIRGCDVVIHLAAPTGGIAFSTAHPASQYRDCSLININMLEAARLEKVARFVAVGNLLAYPAAGRSPLREDEVFDGPVAESHLGIATAKRDLLASTVMYQREYGLPAINVLGANAYGPRDRFDPAHAHVIPATIVKCLGSEDIVVWGDGSATRDFLYVDDLASGILLAAEKLEPPGIVNIASGRETTIRELVETIAGLCEFRGRIRFDGSKGGGNARRLADTNAGSRLGFAPRVPLEEGLRRTIDWYCRQQQVAGAR